MVSAVTNALSKPSRLPDGSHIVYRYLFGPVPSRRLGRSLGIDILPPNTCSFDCLFCQAGVTCSHVDDRSAYTDVQAVLSEFEQWVKEGGSADYVTFSGTGEPTLHSGIGDLIKGVKALGAPKVAVLTNGSLLHMPEVREALSHADLVKVSLGAWDDESLARLNRPCKDISFERHYGGMVEFRRQFTGEIWLEVMIVAGVNDSDEAIQKLAPLASDISPDRIDLNTVVREPSHAGVSPVSRERLEELADRFDPKAEVIGDAKVEIADSEVVGTRRGDAFGDQGTDG